MGNIEGKNYLFGLPRSGTNFAHTLIRSKLNIIFNNPQINGDDLWKHSFNGLNKINEHDKIIFIYKNVYTWIESILIRYPSMGVFIQNTLKNQNLQLSKELIMEESDFLFCDYRVSLESMVNIYKHYINQFKEYEKNHNNILIIKYEDLLIPEKQTHVLKQLYSFFESDNTNYDFFEIDTVPVSKNINKDTLEYYKNEKPIFLPENMVNKINEIIKI